jgi:hypothetical protein
MIKVNSPLWTRPGLFYQCVGYALEVKWPVVFATAGVSVRIVEGWAMSISIIRPSGRRPKKKSTDFSGMVSFAQQNDGASCGKSQVITAENPTRAVFSIPQGVPSHSLPSTSLELTVGSLGGDTDST